jgi:hypothetical protein
MPFPASPIDESRDWALRVSCGPFGPDQSARDNVPLSAFGGMDVDGDRPSGLVVPGPNAGGSDALRVQYSPLITKYVPRMVPASFDFWRANLNESNSEGTSIPSESLNPTARFGFVPSSVYRTLIESPLL